jgi:hypothetical protein
LRWILAEKNIRGCGWPQRRSGDSAMVLEGRRMIKTAQLVNFFLAKDGFFGLNVNAYDISRWFAEFKNVYARRPIADNVGGIGAGSSAWLFLTAKIVNPKLIIESGTWRGHSSWLLRQACPAAEIHSFDFNLQQLLHGGERVVYHEKDWTQHRFEHVDPERSLLFFDDHVNQARRVSESSARGFRFLVFDDNVPADKTEFVGLPPFPTIHMLFDEGIGFGQRFSWQTKLGKTQHYQYLEKDTAGAKSLIEKYFVFPGTPTGLSFVKLRKGVEQYGA